MKLALYHGDILDLDADVLVCSANVSLNLSGGVGGALLSRYGMSLQKELHDQLPIHAPRFARCGDVITTHPAGVPYLAILHAVAVDAFYDSDPGVVSYVSRKALRIASAMRANTVALAALATGFGNLTLSDFAKGLRPVLAEHIPPLERITIGSEGDAEFTELTNEFPKAKIVEQVPRAHPLDAESTG